MEHLVAGIRSARRSAPSGLVIANLIPLVGVLWFGWDVWGILTIYWLENGIVGFFNVLKMRRAAGSEDSSPLAAADTDDGSTVHGGRALARRSGRPS